MSPPISKDWWLAAALSSAAVPAAVAQTPQTTAPRAGVVTAVSAGAPVTSNAQTLMVGSQVVPGQKFATGPNGQLHLLFLDQSAVTLGPDSELVLETFQFDPATRQGQIRLGLTKGLVRVVGGQISKNQPTVVSTPQGKVEIQGGITMVETDGQKTSGVFLFGQGMSTTDNNGNTQTVTRAGFGTSFGTGQPPSTPQRVPVNELNNQLNRLQSSPSNNVAARQISPAPTGQLISTGNTPGGTSNPGGTLANDRLKNVVDTNAGNTPSNTLKTLLGTGQVQHQS
ncbi:FecR family protein [Variovorax sp. N23]|uniref:FecR family protein n=1 Tax=Variovorax sp. N23 TaxID=2980555 RepID=UPI0021C81EA8|nr:FecR family protein [Variovorax sp. N23]MCU4121193.1 FecR family protein [Variovorax sp. N23]